MNECGGHVGMSINFAKWTSPVKVCVAVILWTWTWKRAVHFRPCAFIHLKSLDVILFPLAFRWKSQTRNVILFLQKFYFIPANQQRGFVWLVLPADTTTDCGWTAFGLIIGGGVEGAREFEKAANNIAQSVVLWMLKLLLIRGSHATFFNSMFCELKRQIIIKMLNVNPLWTS